MALTVPTSGLAAGRSADVRLVQPDTGTAIAGLGDAMLQIGTALETDRLDREAQRLDIDMTRDLFRMRQEFEQINDPDAIDRDWPARLAALKQQYLTGTAENGAPRVDRRNRERFDLAFTSLADRHAMELGSRAITLRQAQATALWEEQRTELVVQGATAGDQVLAELLAQGEASIDARAARFGTDAATVQQQKADFRTSIYSQRADSLIANDPAGFLAAAEAGTFNVLGEDLTARKLAAQAEITRRAALEETDRKRTEGERVKAAEARLKDGTAVYRTGSPFAGEAEVEGLLAANPALEETEAAREYRSAQALARARPDFAALPLADKRRVLAKERAKPRDQAYEANVVTAMEAAIAEHEAAITGGTVYDYAGAVTGKPVVPLPGPEATDQDLAQAFYNRRVAAAGIEASGLAGNKRAPLFTPAEREVWAPLAAPDAAPADRARTARLLATAFGAEADRALADLGADGVFASVAEGLAAGALTETVARQTFEGQRILDRQDVAMPPVTARRGAFFAALPTLFPDGTGEDGRDQTKARDSILAAADARYAWLTRNDDPQADGAINEDRYRQALHDVMGGTGTWNSGDATGGVQQLRSAAGGYSLILPPGVNGGEVEDALERIADRMSPGARELYALPEMTVSDWQLLSPKSARPDLDGAGPDAVTLDHMRLRAVGGTQYQVLLSDPETGRDIYLRDDRGQPWTIDITRLLRNFGDGAQP
jgi:hypothetical protein